MTKVEHLSADQLRQRAQAVNANGALPEMIWITVGPELAHDLLAQNPHNRHIRKRKVEQWKGAMKRGEWRPAGQTPLCLTTKGELEDGQNRLAAIIESGKSLLFPIMLGTNSGWRDQETRDQGITRGLGDMLALRGESRTAALGAALRALWAYDYYGTMTAPKRAEATNAQCLKYLRAHPGLRESLEPGEQVRKVLKGPGGAIAAIHTICARADASATDDFFALLITGEGLQKGSPILTVRNQLVRADPHNRPNDRLHTLRRLAWIIKAWNLWMAGEEAAKVIWSPVKGEPFPIVDGAPPLHLKRSNDAG